MMDSLREKVARAIVRVYDDRRPMGTPSDPEPAPADIIAADAAIAAVLDAMREPPERAWNGLARAMIMWMDFDERPTPRALFKHLRLCGHAAPDWLREESEMKSLDHVVSKGTRAVIIWRAMLEAFLQEQSAPTDGE